MNAIMLIIEFWSVIVRRQASNYIVIVIVGPKGDKNYQNDQNQCLKGSKIKLSAIVSRIFN